MQVQEELVWSDFLLYRTEKGVGYNLSIQKPYALASPIWQSQNF